MKKRYTEEQIVKVIKEHEAGASVADICRRLGISTGSLHKAHFNLDKYVRDIIM